MDFTDYDQKKTMALEKLQMDMRLFTHSVSWSNPIIRINRPSIGAIGSVYDQFYYNISRVRNLSNILFNAVAPSIVIERAAIMIQNYLRESGTIMSEDQKNAIINQHISGAVNEFWRDYRNTAAATGYPEHVNEVIDTTIYNLSYSCTNSDIQEGVRSLLQSQITGAWTSIEIMLTDLWEAAVNACPAELCGLESKELGSIIHVDKLKENKFDISQCLGTLIRERTRFDNFNELKKKYKASFMKIDNSIFEHVDDPSIRTLNSVRNIIVHNAGRFDEAYLSAMENTQGAPNGPINSEMNVDAQIVHALLYPAMASSCSIISLIDKWLLEHNQTENEGQRTT